MKVSVRIDTLKFMDPPAKADEPTDPSSVLRPPRGIAASRAKSPRPSGGTRAPAQVDYFKTTLEGNTALRRILCEIAELRASFMVW